MHWPYYDRTTWGLILAIAALILAIPLSIVGNLLTPYIRDWWSRRSVASLRERITTRQKELERLAGIPVMTDHDELVALGLFSIASMVSIVGVIIVWNAGLNHLWAIKAGIRTPSDVNTWFFGVGGMSFAIQLYLLQFQVRYGQLMNDKSPTRRRAMEKSLADLNSRLDAMLITTKH